MFVHRVVRRPRAYTGRDTGGISFADIRRQRRTIAIVDAYDASTIEADLAIFDGAFKLPACTIKNKCLEKHLMASSTATDSGWALETALDVEWAHAIAPGATDTPRRGEDAERRESSFCRGLRRRAERRCGCFDELGAAMIFGRSDP